jgi:hypothetical protein
LVACAALSSTGWFLVVRLLLLRCQLMLEKHGGGLVHASCTPENSLNQTSKLDDVCS